ncbi:MAG: chorismate--pyruvate lyase family protein [Thermodesulfobacteriota bacterium]
MTGLEYSILYPWRQAGQKSLDFKGLGGREEALLFSPDSMTEILEGIFKIEVEVRAVLRERRSMDIQSAAYLQDAEGAEALARGVWIMAHKQPLIYAFSLIPLGSVTAALLKALEGEVPEPIGRTLNSSGIPFIKENLEAGVIRSPFVAEGLHLPAEKTFFARRYVLRGEKSGALVIKAAIIEVFSPELISTECIRG